MKAGTIIPLHVHPCDEPCDEKTFWFTPAYSQQGTHVAVTDKQIIIRLGAMGAFKSAS